jgi:V8-like Glu-specific endopeptidase
LSSPELRQAVAAVFLGAGGRQSVPFSGVEISIPAYFRMISRLCLDEAERYETAPDSVPLAEETGKFGKGASIRVTDTRTVPFRWICSINITSRITRSSGGTSNTGRSPLGTGVLVSPCHVLTAAHLFHSREVRGSVTEHLEATGVSVSMARDEDRKPFGEVEASSWVVHPRWDPDSAAHQYDYALITLEKPVGGDGFWGDPKRGAGTVFGTLPSAMAANLIGAEVMTAGYPGSKNRQMWCFKGTLSAGSPELDEVLKRKSTEEWIKATGAIAITADAERGQSGSPVWVLNDGKRYLLGILVSAGPQINFAVAVNDRVIRQIQSWMSSSACRGVVPAAREWEGGLSLEQEVPPPRGVPAFEHYFQPTKPNAPGLAWASDGPEKMLETLNPGFIDAKDNVISSSALQNGLADLLTGNPNFSKYLTRDSVRLRRGFSGDRIHVALIDLTGTKMTRPEFAGWASTVPVDAGSAIKVAPLYAAYQLKADLEHLARAEGITSTPTLLDTVDARWKRAGIAARPALKEIFNGDQKPPDLAFADDIQDALDHIATKEANVSASLLIRKIGFPYIASALWRAGLRHPQRGGIWLMWNFDSDRPEEWDSPPEPSPGPVFPHTATALSLATFYALIAQGRLPNAPYSAEMKRRLVESWYTGVLPRATITSKVGLDNKCLTWKINDKKKRVCATWIAQAAHEADYIENGSLRYAVAIMTKGIAEGIDVLQALIVEIDNLIGRNNP